MHLLAKLISPVTDFSHGRWETLVSQLVSTGDMAIPSACTWLQAYRHRPESEREPWRDHAAVLILSLGWSGEKSVKPVLLEIAESPVGEDYALVPDFEGMHTRARLREFAAYSCLSVDPETAGRLALEFIETDPFASRVCALILDRAWGPRASSGLLRLVRQGSWKETIATALQVLKRRDSSMYITALQALRMELTEPAPRFRSFAQQFRYFVRRTRIVQALAICGEKSMVKTLVSLLDPEDRGQSLGHQIVVSEEDDEAHYKRSFTEETIVAIQQILDRDFGYADRQPDSDRRTVIDRCKRFIYRNM